MADRPSFSAQAHSVACTFACMRQIVVDSKFLAGTNQSGGY